MLTTLVFVSIFANCVALSGSPTVMTRIAMSPGLAQMRIGLGMKNEKRAWDYRAFTNVLGSESSLRRIRITVRFLSLVSKHFFHSYLLLAGVAVVHHGILFAKKSFHSL